LLVLPIFLVFVLMAVDFGLWMYQNVTAANAVREAARYGSVNCGDGTCDVNDIKTRAVNSSSGLLQAADVTVGWINRTGSASVQEKGDSVVVKAYRDYAFMFTFDAITLSIASCADMRLEKNDSGTSLPTGTTC
jgi:Flp pilus assembly protein TadG